jgi:hypothetical protein
MEEPQKHQDGIREGETQLDYRIRSTKNDLKLDNLYASIHFKEGFKYSHYEEFGFGFNRAPVIRRAFWLLSKLSFLYLVKGFKRLAYSGKQA